MGIDTNRDRAIAVVGASVLYPGSKGSASFWTNILSGQDFMSDIPEGHWLIDDYYNPDQPPPERFIQSVALFYQRSVLIRLCIVSRQSSSVQLIRSAVARYYCCSEGS